MTIETWGILLAMVLFGLTAAVIIVLVWQLFATRRAQGALARDEAFRQLAEQAIEAQQKTAEELADLRERIVRIEKVLKEVE